MIEIKEPRPARRLTQIKVDLGGTDHDLRELEVPVIKSMLVPISGSDTDEVVLATALAAARPFGAHLECFHIRVDPADAVFRTPGPDLVMGSQVHGKLKHELLHEAQALAGSARNTFEQFCARNQIAQRDTPAADPRTTASFRETTGPALPQFVARGRYNDLTIISRAAHPDRLPTNLLEDVLVAGGRPIIIAPSEPLRPASGTVMVAWKESAEAARAVTAAMPYLRTAKRVLVVGVKEGKVARKTELADLTSYLKWHGLAAEALLLADDNRSTADILQMTALTRAADLLVMGGYEHSRTRERLFGGCTRTVLGSAILPVLMTN